MRNCLHFTILLFTALLLFSSCADVKEEIWINKKGEGTYSSQYDMSGMVAMIKMIGQMEGDSPDNPLSEMPDFDSRIDTSFVLSNMVPDSIARSLENPDILSRTTMNVILDMKEEEMKMGIKIDFNSFDEIHQALDELKELRKYMDDGPKGMEAFTDILFGKGLVKNYVLDRGTFSRKAFSLVSDGMMPDNILGSEGGEMAQMMKMMGGQGEYITVLHLPGKIKSIEYDGEYELIDKKTVRLETAFGDLFSEKEIPGFTIEYRCCIFCGIKKNRS